MTRCLIIIFILLNISEYCHSTVLTEPSDLNEYFQLVKNLRYEDADHFASEMENASLGTRLSNLAQILYTAGQSTTYLVDTSVSENRIEQLIYYLTQGYYNLYTNPYSGKPFQYFNEAYNLARELDLKSAEKYTLLSILEVYNFEVSQSNEDKVLFLNRYKDLIDDEADRYHYLINVMQFNLKDIFLNISINLTFFKDFDALMTSFSDNHRFWPNYYSLKAVFYKTIGRNAEAIQLQKKALSLIGTEPFLKYIKFRSNIQLSEIYRLEGDYDRALEYVNHASNSIDLSDTTRSKSYIYYYLSRIYEETEDHEKAFNNLLKATDLRDKLNYEQNSLEIARLNVRYQTQEKELALLKEREKVRDTRNMLGGSVLLIVFISITYYLVQKNTKRKQLLAESEKDLERQKVLSLLKEQELVSIDAMIAGQEKERQRLANELHDDLGGLLASIKLHFHTLLDNEATESNKKFEKTDSLINEAYDKVRAIAHAKNSGVIAKEGFLRSLEEMADKVSIANNLTVTVIEHGLDERLENSLELSLFRIIQELITNVIRHSNATEANIHLTKHDDTLNIMVEDNGEGFDSSGITLKSGGMGIKSIDRRVAFLNGTMNIESEVGQGTTVIIEIPI